MSKKKLFVDEGRNMTKLPHTLYQIYAVGFLSYDYNEIVLSSKDYRVVLK